MKVYTNSDLWIYDMYSLPESMNDFFKVTFLPSSFPLPVAGIKIA